MYEYPEQTSINVFFLLRNLKTIIKDWKNNPVFVDAQITDNELREVTCSADRSGYVIYQSDNKYNL